MTEKRLFFPSDLKEKQITLKLLCFISKIQNNLFDLFLFILNNFVKNQCHCEQKQGKVNVAIVQKNKKSLKTEKNSQKKALTLCKNVI